MKVSKLCLTGIVVGTCLFASGSYVNRVYANNILVPESSLAEKVEKDVSTGWTVTNYSSSLNIDVDKIFSQGHTNEEINQKMAMANFANIGESTFTAERIISLEKGKTYSISLIYAMLYTMGGTGYIDFNGDRQESDNSSGDKKYEREITPKEDMEYKIVIHYDIPAGANGYFKVGYDLDNGGINVDESKIEAPIISPAPEAATKLVMGTAVAGNTITVTDSEENVIGNSVVDDDGHFSVETTRLLRYREKIWVTQKSATSESDPAEVLVVKTSIPDAPTINKVTDEDTIVTGSGEPLSIIHLKIANDVYEAEVGEDGNYSIELDSAYPGLTKITAYVTDVADNMSDTTESIVLFAAPLTFSVDNKLSSIDQNISGGTSRPDCKVKVYFGQRVYEVQSDSAGRFEITLDHSYPAGTDYTIQVVDELSGEVAKDGYKVLPRKPSFTETHAGTTELTGVADPGAKIDIILYKSEQKFEFSGTSDAEGNFVISLLDEDEKEITIEIGDRFVGTSSITDLELSSEEVEIFVFAR